jgi:hypothetical protein
VPLVDTLRRRASLGRVGDRTTSAPHVLGRGAYSRARGAAHSFRGQTTRTSGLRGSALSEGTLLIRPRVVRVLTVAIAKGTALVAAVNAFNTLVRHLPKPRRAPSWYLRQGARKVLTSVSFASLQCTWWEEAAWMRENLAVSCFLHRAFYHREQ